MTLQGTGTFRKTLVGTLAAAAVAISALFVTAAPAGAALGTNPYLTSWYGETVCHQSNRVMTFGVTFQFDSRYTGLEGKWVSANFRYYSVDPAGRRTSGYGHTDYGAPALLASTKRNPNTGVVYSDYAHLSNGWVQWAGQRLRADVNIAVWDRHPWICTRMAHDSDIHLLLLGWIAVESRGRCPIA